MLFSHLSHLVRRPREAFWPDPWCMNRSNCSNLVNSAHTTALRGAGWLARILMIGSLLSGQQENPVNRFRQMAPNGCAAWLPPSRRVAMEPQSKNCLDQKEHLAARREKRTNRSSQSINYQIYGFAGQGSIASSLDRTLCFVFVLPLTAPVAPCSHPYMI